MMTMMVLGAVNAVDDTMRLILLLMLIIAVVLIVTGAIVATVTLVNVRKAARSHMTELESERT